MRIFAILNSFFLMCAKQGIPIDKAFLALACGADPADVFKLGRVVTDRWGGAGRPTRPGRGPVSGLGSAAQPASDPAASSDTA